MKKLTALILVIICVMGLTGCTRTMDDVIGKEPELVGIVDEVLDNKVLVKVDPSEAEYDNFTVVIVPLEVEIADSYLNCSVGDEIIVYYDGSIIDGEPAVVERVYAITLKTPADRTVNNKS